MRATSCFRLAALALVVLAGCGSGTGAADAERCFGGGIYDYAAEHRGEDTPGAVVRAAAEHTEARIETELETIAATEERDRRLAQDRAAVRGLRVLQSAADAADGAGTLEATADEGNVVARADVAAAPGGGFLLSSLSVEADCEDAA